jgi:hypothetical protein
VRNWRQSAIAQRREKRTQKEPNYADDLPPGLFLEDTTDDTSATPEMLDGPR